MFVKLQSQEDSLDSKQFPSFKSVSMDNYGLAELKFSDELFIPKLSRFNETSLEIKVISESDENQGSKL